MARLHQTRSGYRANSLIGRVGRPIGNGSARGINNPGRQPFLKKLNLAKASAFRKGLTPKLQNAFDAIAELIKKRPSVSSIDMSIIIARELTQKTGVHYGDSTVLRLYEQAVARKVILSKQ